MPEAPILICYDGSESSRRAIDAAAALFGARRAVVLDIGPALTAAESLATLSPLVGGATFEDLNQEEALSSARVGAQLAEHAGFAAEPRAVVEAPTWMGIVEVADEIDAPVIVIGSRGLDKAHELFEGSVSHEVAEHAGRPVLIVPPEQRASKHA